MIQSLVGTTVVRWSAIEMALNDSLDASAIIWQHSSVPMLQLMCLHAQLSNETWQRFTTYQDDDQWGLLLSFSDGSATTHDEWAPIFRLRDLPELPCGQIISAHLEQNRRGNIVSIDLQIGNRTVNLFNGEIYERQDAMFEVVLEDESVLVQVDRRRPQVE